jgi:uncharacterized linocin/CFP29 family protein
MADSNMQLQWTDEQWNKVRQVVYEEARRARVAGNVLPLYGPLDPDARYASKQLLSGPDPQRGNWLKVEDRDTLRLITLRELVHLRGAQVADPDLSSALLAFRRAANRIARREDELIFNGRGRDDEVSTSPPNPETSRSWQSNGEATPSADDLTSLPTHDWLVTPARKKIFVEIPAQAERAHIHQTRPPRAEMGSALVIAVSKAIAELEKDYHLGPFACLLGHQYFFDVVSPADSMVMPQDRILPFLQGGALLRTSVLDDEQGLVVALGGAPIDLVVATDISVGFLQATPEADFVFRVYEKIVLRIKEPEAIRLLSPRDRGNADAAEDSAGPDAPRNARRSRRG